MKTRRLILLMGCIAAVLVLTGCNESGGDSAGGYGGSSFAEGSSNPGPGSHPANPEPATMALLGSGAAAYAFLKRKRNK